mgnify:CR=1 FL=1
MDTKMRAELVQQYKDGVAKVREALMGATDAELDARPAPDKWTAREIVHHLADSEMTSAIRLRRLIAEDKPVIVGYDQEEFTRRLHYDRPVAGYGEWPEARLPQPVGGDGARGAQRRACVEHGPRQSVERGHVVGSQDEAPQFVLAVVAGALDGGRFWRLYPA